MSWSHRARIEGGKTADGLTFIKATPERVALPGDFERAYERYLLCPPDDDTAPDAVEQTEPIGADR